MKIRIIILSIVISIIHLQNTNNSENALNKPEKNPLLKNEEKNSELKKEDKNPSLLNLNIQKIPEASNSQKNEKKDQAEKKDDFVDDILNNQNDKTKNQNQEILKNSQNPENLQNSQNDEKLKNSPNSEFPKNYEMTEKEKKQMKKEINREFAQHQKKNKIKIIDGLIVLDKNNKKMEIGKYYDLKKKGELEIPSSLTEELLIIKISGLGMIKLSIRSNVENLVEDPEKLKNNKNSKNPGNPENLETEIISQTLFISNQHTNHIIPISTSLLKNKKNLILTLTNNNIYSLEKITINISLGGNFIMAFNDSVKFTTKYIRKLNLKIQDFFYYNQKKNNRIEFFLQTSLENQEIQGDEIVEMFINKSKILKNGNFSNEENFPSRENFDFAPFGNIGKGLIKTLRKNRDYTCEKNCEFFVTFFLENIDFVFFYPSFVPNFSEFFIKDSLEIIEAVDKDETLTYVLNLQNLKNDWVFNISPFENDTEFYINPEVLPKKLSDYKYKGKGEGEEDFLITNNSLNSSKTKKTEKIFLTFKPNNNKNASFTFTAKTTSKKIQIQEDTLETGKIPKNKIINYFLDLSSSEKTLYTLKLKLKSFVGNCDLYVKECLVDEIDCKISNEDIEFSYFPDKSDYFENRIFRYSRMDVVSGDDSTFDEILMNFNCLNSLTKKKKGIYEFSKSCLFAVAVYNRGFKKIYDKKDLTVEEKMENEVVSTENDIESEYSLKITGQEKINEIYFWESASLTLREKTRILIQLKKDADFFEKNYKQKKTLSLKIVSVTGNCKIYISTKTTNPNSSDFESKLEFKREENLELKTITKKIQIDIEDKNKDQIFILIEADSYSFIDIYPSLVSEKNPFLPENLILDNLVNRSITRENSYMENDDFVYFENFLFLLKKGFLKKDSLDVTVNSGVLGIEICVQFNVEDFVSGKKCDRFSESEILEFEDIGTTLENVDKFVIQIRLRIKKDQIFTRFPVNYSLVINSSYNSTVNFQKIKIAKPGEVHIKKLSPKSYQVYEIDFSQMKKNGYISFTTEQIGIMAFIKNSEKDIIDIQNNLAYLDKFNFGFYITDVYLFKTEFWNSGLDSLFVSVYNSGTERGRFSLIYCYDDVPIYLKDGNSFFIPSQRKSYFVSEVEKEKEFNCDFDSEIVEFETFSKVFNSVTDLENIDKIVDEDIFDFKTSQSTLGEIVIPTSTLITHELPKIAILYNPIPKKGEKTDPKGPTTPKKTKTPKKSKNKTKPSPSYKVLSQNSQTTLSTHSSLKKLLPYTNIHSTSNRGEFKYFYITPNSPKTPILISLSVTTGESDLYINRGLNNLPTTTNYYKKSTTYKGDEIELKPNTDFAGVYTIGVYSREFSKFSIVFSPGFGNLYKVRHQRLVEMRLKGGEFYYFEYNNNLERFSTFLFARESGVCVDSFDFEEGQGENLADLLENERDYEKSFCYEFGRPPSRMVLEDVWALKRHFVLRMKSERDTSLLFLIYDPREPVEIFSDKRFDFVLNAMEEQVFVVNLDSDFKDVDLDVKLNFGQIDFSVNDQETFNKFETLSKPDQKYIEYFKDLESSNTEIVTFNQIFIKVKSKKLSSFSILAKPKTKFKKLRKNENEIIYTSKNRDKYLYFELTKKSLKNYKTLTFNISMINSYSEKPELYFVPDLNFTLNNKSPFIPMPLLDYSSKKFPQFLNLIIKPQLTAGIYIFKIKKHYDRVPLKISISANSEKSIELNSIQKNFLPSLKKNDVFSVYVPEAGEFRIVLESCKNVAVLKTVFLSIHGEKERVVDFEGVGEERFKFFYFDVLKNKIDFREDMVINLKKAFFDRPGIVRFEVGLLKGHRFLGIKRKPFYEVLTEFRPKDKEMVFKDYVVLENDLVKPRVEYNFFGGNTRMNVKTRLPFFKDQLFMDYPNINKIEFNITIYIFEDKNEEFAGNLQKCGFSILEDTKKTVIKTQRIVLPIEKINHSLIITNFVSERNLKIFKHSETITMFEKLEINFIENEKDEFNITLDRKFLTIPYFLIRIPNKNKQSNSLRFFLASIKLLVISFVFLILAICYVLYKRKKSKENLGNIYNQENSEIQNIENSKDDLDFNSFVMRDKIGEEGEKEIKEVKEERGEKNMSESSEEIEEKQYSYEI